MKLFRRIAALALVLVVVTMLGISASAASFRKLDIFGDFGAGAIFEGNLTSNNITAAVEFIPNSDSNILQSQRIQLSFTIFDNLGNMVDPDDLDEDELVMTKTRNGYHFRVDETLVSGMYFASATYSYDAYYIANGIVDCFLYSGPITLSRP